MNLTEGEKKALRGANLAVFRGRVIFDAQPPIKKAALEKLAKHFAGPIPKELISLWQTAFGGSLDYDLRVRFGDHEARLSFRELFFPKSDGYTTFGVGLSTSRSWPKSAQASSASGGAASSPISPSAASSTSNAST